MPSIPALDQRTHAIADDEVSEVYASETRLVAANQLARQHEVVITGLGTILPNCDDRRQFWHQLQHGECQLAIEPDPADQIPCAMGRIRDFDAKRYLRDIPPKLFANCHREQQLYLSSVVTALGDAGLDRADVASDRVALFSGTSRGSFAFWYELFEQRASRPDARFNLRELHLGMPGQAVGIAAALLGVKGPTYTFNATCASGLVAIGHAFRELQAGRIDVAFGTGHDAALVPPLFQMYRAARLISAEREHPDQAIRPYSGSTTNAFGEGAITLVMETREHAEARGATILAEIAGFRQGNGGEHPTDVDFTGERPARLVNEVLEEAGVTPGAIDFVLGHGNGVQASDISELNYMKRLFGRRTRDVPLISTKPIYGHTLGASSALNAAAAALMLHDGFVIPTVGVDERRVVHGFNHQANQGVARPLKAGVVVAYGIGGQNATLLLRKAGR